MRWFHRKVNRDLPTQGEIGWYISDTHARRAIGYLAGSVPELASVDVPRLAEEWAKAIQATLDWNEMSPIGPEAGRRVVPQNLSSEASDG